MKRVIFLKITALSLIALGISASYAQDQTKEIIEILNELETQLKTKNAQKSTQDLLKEIKTLRQTCSDPESDQEQKTQLEKAISQNKSKLQSIKATLREERAILSQESYISKELKEKRQSIISQIEKDFGKQQERFEKIRKDAMDMIGELITIESKNPVALPWIKHAAKQVFYFRLLSGSLKKSIKEKTTQTGSLMELKSDDFKKLYEEGSFIVKKNDQNEFLRIIYGDLNRKKAEHPVLPTLTQDIMDQVEAVVINPDVLQSIDLWRDQTNPQLIQDLLRYEQIMVEGSLVQRQIDPAEREVLGKIHKLAEEEKAAQKTMYELEQRLLRLETCQKETAQADVKIKKLKPNGIQEQDLKDIQEHLKKAQKQNPKSKTAD